jgi:outer membrane protein assembly factor BamB
MTKRSVSGRPAWQAPARMQPRQCAMRSGLKLITMRMIACCPGLLGLSMGFASFASAQDIDRVIVLPDLPFVIPILVPPIKSPLDEWYTYRYNNARTGAQPYKSALSDPAKVRTLHVGWTFPLEGAVGAFKASPIVVNDTVFIGSVNGYFYALDAAGKPKWQYPKASDPPLLGSCGQGGNGSFGRYGIQSSATYANIEGRNAIIFGAPDPDPSAEGGLGSARLFALMLSGDLIWKSEIVAHLSGCTPGSLFEAHGRITYSSPLVLGNKVYVGVHNAGDDPIQNGKVVAVDLNTGHIDSNFHYISTATGTRGGGVYGIPSRPMEPVFTSRLVIREFHHASRRTIARMNLNHRPIMASA